MSSVRHLSATTIAGLSRLLVLGCLLLVGLGPGVAAAQTGNPFSPLPPEEPDPTTVATTSTTGPTTTDDGLERWQETLIFLAGVALLSGIAFAIVRDARRAAPVTAEDGAGAHATSPGGSRKTQQSKAKARKKAKAARAARKHNR